MRETGLPVWRASSAKTSSAGVIPARASMRKRIISASTMAACVCRRMRPSTLLSSPSSRPAVSTNLALISPNSMSASRLSLVMPGRGSTRARRLPASRLKRVDFPTFGRPIMATVKDMSFLKPKIISRAFAYFFSAIMFLLF